MLVPVLTVVNSSAVITISFANDIGARVKIEKKETIRTEANILIFLTNGGEYCIDGFEFSTRKSFTFVSNTEAID
jgi:hypothetical protein